MKSVEAYLTTEPEEVLCSMFDSCLDYGHLEVMEKYLAHVEMTFSQYNHYKAKLYEAKRQEIEGQEVQKDEFE